MNDVNADREQELIDAAWLMGFGAGCFVNGTWPDGVEEAELQQHCFIAAQILSGGGFNPLEVWEALGYARELRERVKTLVVERPMLPPDPDVVITSPFFEPADHIRTHDDEARVLCGIRDRLLDVLKAHNRRCQEHECREIPNMMAWLAHCIGLGGAGIREFEKLLVQYELTCQRDGCDVHKPSTLNTGP